MFTVIICDKGVMEDCSHDYGVYLKPFMENPGFAFCRWNPRGETLAEAVPDLEETISSRKDWSALIVYDRGIIDVDGISKRNPFDYAGAVVNPRSLDTAEEVISFRESKRAAYDRAMGNPLTKLSAWLLGLTMRDGEISKEYRGLPDITDENYFEALDDAFVLPLDYELERLRAEKTRMLNSQFNDEGMLFNPPKQVIVTAERVAECGESYEDVSLTHDEFEYSRFYEDNLYNDKLRYLLCDVSYVDGRRDATDYLKMLMFMLLLAQNGCPIDAIRANRVYKATTKFNEKRMAQLYFNYNKKLERTGVKLKVIDKHLREKELEEISYSLSEMLFEKDISIPVTVRHDFDKNELWASARDLGLSTDCPTDEAEAWKKQYHRIGTRFLRYLREPRRAIDVAVRYDMRRNYKIEDERIIQLNEYQQEDVMIHLQESEEKMVKTVTTKLYKTAEYTKRLETADKKIKNRISLRMTKKKVLIIAIVAAVAYLLGFMPLIFSNLNTDKSRIFSFAATGIAVGALLVIGFVALLCFRHRLVKLFDIFNATMGGILKEIEQSMESFSEYIGHACDVMRSFSVFRRLEKPISKKREVLQYHEAMIDKNICEAQKAFAGFVSFEGIDTSVQPGDYDYDFSVARDYDYPMPYDDSMMRIEFMRQGNVIEVPVDYLNEVTVERVELYE